MAASLIHDRGMSVRSAPRNHGSANRAERYAAIGLLTLIHLVAFWIMAAAIRIGVPGSNHLTSSTELQIRLLSPNLGPREPLAPPLDWDFDTPENILVPEPQITIMPRPEDTSGVGATPVGQKFPPRLDPAHVNEKPQLPHTLGAIVGALRLELHILVLADGSVGQVRIIKSTGEADIDRLAIETVQNSWRYLPATVNGKPIEAWTTVTVWFASL